MAVNSPWFLLHFIATDAHGHEESHILSCHCRKQKGHYYPIESAGDKSVVF